VVLAIGGGGGGARLDSTTTGETGAYTFTTDSTGTRQILVSAEGYVSGSAFVNIASDTGTYTANITINPPLPPGSIAGKVSKASDSSALEGARVILSRFGGGGGGGFTPDTAVTDAEGAYAFDSIPVNSGYSLAVSLDGYQNMTRGSVRVASDSVSTQNFFLAPPPNPGSVAGKVSKASDSSALAGARVILSRGGGGGGGGFTPDTALTDAEGEYAFDSIPANTGYSLSVSFSGYVSINRGSVRVAPDSVSTQNFFLALPPDPGSISGKVAKESDSSALAGARVILSRFGGGGGGGFTPDTALTDAEGEYAFDSIPANTGYSLSVSLQGYVSTTRGSVRVASDSITNQNFFLDTPTPPGSISGKVTKAADDAALAGVRVILSRSGGGGGGGFSPDTVLTDAAGIFQFDSVPNQNNFTLTVSAEGFATMVNNNVDVAGGLETEVDFALTASVEGDTTATIKGIVTDAATDEPVADATVILTRLGQGGGGGQGTAMDTVTTNEDGEYAFDSLPAGSYRVTASAGGKSGAGNSLPLVAGAVFVADIALTPSSGIAVRTRSAVGAFRTHWVSGRMVVELGRFAGSARTVEVYSPDGALKHRIPVAPGSASVVLPAAVTPATGSLVRLGY